MEGALFCCRCCCCCCCPQASYLLSRTTHLLLDQQRCWAVWLPEARWRSARAPHSTSKAEYFPPLFRGYVLIIPECSKLPSDPLLLQKTRVVVPLPNPNIRGMRAFTNFLERSLSVPFLCSRSITLQTKLHITVQIDVRHVYKKCSTIRRNSVCVSPPPFRVNGCSSASASTQLVHKTIFRRPITIKRCIIGVLAGCLKEKSWQKACSSAFFALDRVAQRATPGKKEADNRRGIYPSIAYGISLGNGNTVGLPLTPHLLPTTLHLT
jgi:hypothetical protein